MVGKGNHEKYSLILQFDMAFKKKTNIRIKFHYKNGIHQWYRVSYICH